MSTFKIEEFSIIYNNIPLPKISQANCLLQRSLPFLKDFTERDWGKLFQSGAHIFTALHDPTGSVVALVIYLPVNRSSDRYHCKYAVRVHERFRTIASTLLHHMESAAKEYLKKTHWEKISITEDEQWETFFPHR